MHQRLKRGGLFLTLFLSLFVQGLPGLQAQNDSPLELHEAVVGQISKLNPLFAVPGTVDADISALIYEGLTTTNAFGEVVPDLASEWTVSRDGLAYVVRLRQDVLWQDGLPFTAADVAYTIRTMRARDFPGDPSLTAFWRTVEMDVIDDYTIRFRLVQPLASFPALLQQGIVPAHALEAAPIETLDEHPFNLSPIGTGPYQLESLLTSGGGELRGVSLRVAPNYRLRPEGAEGFALDRIVIRSYPTIDEAIEALQQGRVNSLSGLPPARLAEFADLGNLTVNTTLAPEIGVLIFNWQRPELPYFRDQDFRLAVTAALDRQASVQQTMRGQAVLTDSPIPATSWAYNPAAAYPPPDLEAARRLLERVSFEPIPVETPEDSGNPEATPDATPEPEATPVEVRRQFSILVSETQEPQVALAESVAEQWSALDFEVRVEALAPDAYLERLSSGDFDVALVEYTLAADPDQFSLWHAGQADIGLNYGAMEDSFISSLLEQARRDPSGVNRKQLYDDFQVAFTMRAPAIVLYTPLFIYLTDSRLSGVQLNFIGSPADRFKTLQDWRFSP